MHDTRGFALKTAAGLVIEAGPPEGRQRDLRQDLQAIDAARAAEKARLRCRS